MDGGTILWRRLYAPGHDAARLSFQEPYWHLEGAAVFALDGQPCRLDYRVICDGLWRTQSATVVGWVAGEALEVSLVAGADGRWRINGAECPAVAGAEDVDLSFTPATNLLPIRRLNLAVGRRAEARAAWLRFPGLTCELLSQTYERSGVSTYRYEAAGGAFVTELTVNPVGFVTGYPGGWQAEAEA